MHKGPTSPVICIYKRRYFYVHKHKVKVTVPGKATVPSEFLQESLHTVLSSSEEASCPEDVYSGARYDYSKVNAGSGQNETTRYLPSHINKHRNDVSSAYTSFYDMISELRIRIEIFSINYTPVWGMKQPTQVTANKVPDKLLQATFLSTLGRSEFIFRMDYYKFFSENARHRQTSWIGSLRKYLQNPPPELLWLAGGLPNASMFPFCEAKVKLRDGHVIEMGHDLMASALQYGGPTGYAPLLKHLANLTQQLHAPPCWSTTQQVMTVGGQDGLAKAFVMLTDPGDYVIIPEPCYAGIFAELSALNPRYLAIEEDGEGMKPDVLRSTLARWKAETGGNDPGRQIKFMYMNPSGSNPSGTTMSEARRREIYALACEYDFLILEDDPYYFLQFIDDLPPSFLSLDTEGRVLRFDSFSKTVSAGLRVGYVTGPKVLVEKISQHIMATVMGSAGLSQVLIAELFNYWGLDGFHRHVKEVREFYRSKRDAIVLAAEKHLTGLCEWNVPQGGMFLWLKVLGVKDTEGLLLERGVARNILLVPGKGFTTKRDLPCQYMRASYSTITPEQMDKAFRILAEVIREELQRSK
ncbi:kynurenine/alpha-aminoadipate aminotransferase, mitochondrial-like [Penaeus japonicus]|uniref:kynurenine/alpha-aminoadipate aminotransferase, mitochondrial-like n=1 Tax=Penaeus japonicus TaxID=27405 RepID=UPI001C712404|nr:kynurenine/alpha-aminoadipate aminotransferase, mitochondrial-like [Penaeus japonicus]